MDENLRTSFMYDPIGKTPARQLFNIYALFSQVCLSLGHFCDTIQRSARRGQRASALVTSDLSSPQTRATRARNDPTSQGNQCAKRTIQRVASKSPRSAERDINYNTMMNDKQSSGWKSSAYTGTILVFIENFTKIELHNCTVTLYHNIFQDA